MFGTDHIYQTDTYNEMIPRSNDPNYLKSSSAAVFNAMKLADSEAIWVMQGWLFWAAKSFWQPPQIQALLSGVPDDRMIILDLWSDQWPLYEITESYFGKPFIWCMLHAFGGEMELQGRMDVISSVPNSVMKNQSLTMIGIGLTMEGMDQKVQNYLIYEMMTSNFWSPNAIEVSQYLCDYAFRRYGGNYSDMSLALEYLRSSVYNSTSPKSGYSKSLIEMLPTMTTPSTYSFREVILSWNIFVSFMNSNPGSLDIETFRFDAVDISRQVLSQIFLGYYHNFTSCYSLKCTNLSLISSNMLNLILDLETLLASNEYFLLGKWLSDAISADPSGNYSAVMSFNAINQITMWGPNGEINGVLKITGFVIYL